MGSIVETSVTSGKVSIVALFYRSYFSYGQTTRKPLILVDRRGAKVSAFRYPGIKPLENTAWLPVRRPATLGSENQIWTLL
jgi:hypothetical protein